MTREPLEERIQAGVRLLEALPGRRRITVVADADVDGTAAAAVLARALHRLGRRFRVVLTRRRDKRLVELVKKRAPAMLVTADLGAGIVGDLARLRVPTVILDHHEPGGDGDGDGLVHVNPHLVGEDGSTGASGAAVSYRFAEALLAGHGADARDLLPYALLGAWGDRYHGAAQDTGLHARLHEEALGDDIPIHWRPWTPEGSPEAATGKALAEGLDPVLSRLGGQEKNAASVLGLLGIDPATPVGRLDDDARVTLASWTAAALLEEGADAGLTASMLAPRFVFASPGPLAGQSVSQVAFRVDCATRQGKEADALAALAGHDAAWREIERDLPAYRSAVSAPVFAAVGAAVNMAGAHLVRVEAGSLAGPVADRIMAWTRLGTAPVVVIGPAPGGVKASLRSRSGTPWRLDRIADTAARSVGGVGGGHRLAAGALVPEGKEARFLEAVAAALKDHTPRGTLRRGPEATA